MFDIKGVSSGEIIAIVFAKLSLIPAAVNDVNVFAIIAIVYSFIILSF
tara:strand:- start:203 stop:346 length:144 start_codon:yes stop_codon:yes gene_type:complete